MKGSVLVLGFLISAVGCTGANPRVVLYCAQDKEFAEDLLADFEKRTGVHVDVKYDTENQKSVSLAKELIQEQSRPRCDVFWNNEILGTIRLQRLNGLASYASPAAAPFPAAAKATDHTWTAFGARARVLLVNTNLVSEDERPKSILELTAPRWKGRVGMAKPLYGTTATQAVCLFEVLGADQAKQFFRDLKKNDIQIVAGNKDAAVGVSNGQFAVGFTDTDDALGEIRAGKPVAMLFPDRDQPKTERMGTLFIPNTIAVIKGCPKPDAAHRLVDFLLSPDVEACLAAGESHQIPLNPSVHADLPKEMLVPTQVKTMDVDFEKAADLWDEVARFLADEFTRP